MSQAGLQVGSLSLNLCFAHWKFVWSVLSINNWPKGSVCKVLGGGNGGPDISFVFRDPWLVVGKSYRQAVSPLLPHRQKRTLGSTPASQLLRVHSWGLLIPAHCSLFHAHIHHELTG